jgi:hypothetical protein
MDTLLFLVCWLSGCPGQHGLASVYWPGDGHCGAVRADGERFSKDDFHLASRTLPLLEEVLVCNQRTARCVKAPVLDRGPYGFCRRKHKGDDPRCRDGFKYEVRIGTRSKKGYYRGVADLTRNLANSIGHNGLEPISIYRIGKAKSKRKLLRAIEWIADLQSSQQLFATSSSE